MGLFTILAIITGVIGTLISFYPKLNPEDVRMGREVGPDGDIQRAIERKSKPHFWTDRKIYSLGLIVYAITVTFTILALTNSVDP